MPQIARTPENEQAAFDCAIAMLERIHGMARSANGDYSPAREPSANDQRARHYRARLPAIDTHILLR